MACWTAADRDRNPEARAYSSSRATSSSEILTLTFIPLCYPGRTTLLLLLANSSTISERGPHPSRGAQRTLAYLAPRPPTRRSARPTIRHPVRANGPHTTTKTPDPAGKQVVGDT